MGSRVQLFVGGWEMSLQISSSVTGSNMDKWGPSYLKKDCGSWGQESRSSRISVVSGVYRLTDLHPVRIPFISLVSGVYRLTDLHPVHIPFISLVSGVYRLTDLHPVHIPFISLVSGFYRLTDLHPVYISFISLVANFPRSSGSIEIFIINTATQRYFINTRKEIKLSAFHVS